LFRRATGSQSLQLLSQTCPFQLKLLALFLELEQLISEFERQTGVPVVLNTSFNEHEPIVATPAEAIACYLKTRMDVLALGNWVLSRPSASPQ